MDVGSCQRVTDADAGIKIGIQDFKLFRAWQFCKRLSRGIGECAANSQDRLKSLSGIDKDTNLSLQGLAQIFEKQGVSSREAVITVVSGGIDFYLFPLDSFPDLKRLRGFRGLSVCHRQ